MGMRRRQPPRLALLLLSLAAPPAVREYVAGDLHEEFVRCHRGRWWFWGQVLRSIPCLVSLVEWRKPAATVIVAGAWLVLGWQLLWMFVLSQVPYKADPAAFSWRLFQ
jgi:hypothetical protein